MIMFKDKLLREMLVTCVKYSKDTGKKYLESYRVNDIWREFKWLKSHVKELQERIEYLENPKDVMKEE